MESLEPGVALPSELELRQRFNVSRPTIREAFRILENQGMITVVRGAHGGARVARPDKRIVVEHGAVYLITRGLKGYDLKDARLVIEPQAMAWLAKRISGEGVQALRGCVEAQYGAMKSPREFRQVAYQFYLTLTELCPNPAISLLLYVLCELFLLYSYTEPDDVPTREMRARFLASIKAKEILLDYFEKRDAKGAQAHWTKYIIEIMEQQKRAGRADQRADMAEMIKRSMEHGRTARQILVARP